MATGGQLRQKAFNPSDALNIDNHVRRLQSLAFGLFVIVFVDVVVFLVHLIAYSVAYTSLASNENDLLVGVFLSLHFLFATPLLVELGSVSQRNATALRYYSTLYEPPKRSTIAALFFSLWTSVVTTAYAYKFKSNLPQRWFTIVVIVWQFALFWLGVAAFSVNRSVRVAPKLFDLVPGVDMSGASLSDDAEDVTSTKGAWRSQKDFLL